MGMAASQYRLLFITSKISDLEFQAQCLEEQKLRLALDQDAAYEEYCNALDAKKITVAFNTGINTKYVDANFSTLCSFNENRQRDYILTNNMTGMVIVSNEIKNCYDEFGNDKYGFVWACMGYEADDFIWYYEDANHNVLMNQLGTAQEVGFGTSNGNYSLEDTDYADGCMEGQGNCFMTGVERIAFNEGATDELRAYYEDVCELAHNENASDSDKQEALDKFREKLYIDLGAEIFLLMNQNKDAMRDDENPTLIQPNRTNWTAPSMEHEFNYYLSLWEAIRQAGGCEAMDARYSSGDGGTEWLNNMVNAGLVTISSRDYKTREGFKETSISSTVDSNHLMEEDVGNDKAAEIKYKHILDKIKDKETKIDAQLKRTETDHDALKTQYEAVKKIEQENIEKTFNIFS